MVSAAVKYYKRHGCFNRSSTSTSTSTSPSTRASTRKRTSVSVKAEILEKPSSTVVNSRRAQTAKNTTPLAEPYYPTSDKWFGVPPLKTVGQKERCSNFEKDEDVERFNQSYVRCRHCFGDVSVSGKTDSILDQYKWHNHKRRCQGWEPKTLAKRRTENIRTRDDRIWARAAKRVPPTPALTLDNTEGSSAIEGPSTMDVDIDSDGPSTPLTPLSPLSCITNDSQTSSPTPPSILSPSLVLNRHTALKSIVPDHTTPYMTQTHPSTKPESYLPIPHLSSLELTAWDSPKMDHRFSMEYRNYDEVPMMFRSAPDLWILAYAGDAQPYLARR